MVFGVVEVEEAKIELDGANGAKSNSAGSDPVLCGSGFGGQPVGGGQTQAAMLLGEENRYARHQQRIRQLLDDRFEQRIEIGLRTEAAAKLDQGLAVVVAMAVEGLVDPTLNPAFERLKEGGHQHDSDALAPVPHRLGKPVVGQPGRCGNHAEVARQDQAGGQRVRHAALEDQVGVHQPVADDGPTEGERQKDDRESCQIGEPAWAGCQSKKEGNGVKQREGHYGQQRAASEPLQLLAQQGRVGAVVTAHEERAAST